MTAAAHERNPLGEGRPVVVNMFKNLEGADKVVGAAFRNIGVNTVKNLASAGFDSAAGDPVGALVRLNPEVRHLAGQPRAEGTLSAADLQCSSRLEPIDDPLHDVV